VVAITYFSPEYGNDSVILQYAHRVLEQHPVEVTFFFVPQVVQALRHDALGTDFLLGILKLIVLQVMSSVLYSKRRKYRSSSAIKSFGI